MSERAYSRLPLDEIDALLRDRVEGLVTHIVGNPPNRHLSRRDESRFGNKGGISVATAGRNKGRITVFDGDGIGRSPLQFIQSELHLSFSEALSWASNWLGLDSDYRPDPKAEDRRRQKREKDQAEAEVAATRQRQKKISKAEELANKSVSVAGTDGEAYLRSRAITASLPDCVRYSQLPQALMLIATSPSGAIQAVQRVFLDGDRKANVTPQKRTNGPLKNAAVRLPGDGCRLYMAEGPETALSVWQATGAPTWAVLGQNFRDHDIPDAINEIVIAADNDPEGSAAFKQTKKSAEHYHQRGYAVFIARPDGPLKYDFNDVHQERGEIAVRRLLELAPRWIGAPALYEPPSGTIERAREGAAAFITEWVQKAIEYWTRRAEYDADR